jgi:hypothetical protein
MELEDAVFGSGNHEEGRTDDLDKLRL